MFATMRGAVGLMLLASVLPLVLCGGGAVSLFSSPLVLWGNNLPGLGPESVYVSYEVQVDAGVVASDVLKMASGLDVSSSFFITEQPNTAVVYIGKQLDAADLRKGGREDTLNPLMSLISAATSSLVMPYSRSQESAVLSTITSTLQENEVKFQVIGCSADASLDVVAEVRSALSGVESSVQTVLLVCSSIGTDQTAANLQAELSELSQVSEAVTSDPASSSLFIYASESTTQPGAATGRSLLMQEGSGDTINTLFQYTGFGKYTNCDVLCQTHVRWLEGILAALILAITACAGLSCLYVLDTPTRFEAAKDVPRAQ